MAVNKSQAYNIGYGKQAPSLGYGMAQVKPDAGVRDFYKDWADSQRVKARGAKMKQEAESAFDKAKAEAAGEFKFFNNSDLNNAANKYYENTYMPAINSVDPLDPNYRTKLQGIINESNKIFSSYGEIDERFTQNRGEYQKGGFESNPYYDEYGDGVLMEIDPNNPDSYAAVGSLVDRYSTLIKQPERINYVKRIDDIAKDIVPDLMSNEDFVRNSEQLKGRGLSLQEFIEEAELTPSGVERLRSSMVNDPSINRELELSYSEIENPELTLQEFKQKSINDELSKYSKRRKTELRSKPIGRQPKGDGDKLAIAKEVKDNVNKFQDTFRETGNVQDINQYIAPYGLTVEKAADDDTSVQFVDENSQWRSEPIKIDDAESIYNVIAKKNAHIRRDYIDKVEFEDPTKGDKIENPELKTDVTSILEGREDDVISKFEGVEVERNTTSPDILKVDGKEFNITDPKTAKEAFEYLEKRGYRNPKPNQDLSKPIKIENSDVDPSKMTIGQIYNIEGDEQIWLGKDKGWSEPAADGYKLRQEDDGYIYLGGDPSKEENWEKIK